MKFFPEDRLHLTCRLSVAEAVQRIQGNVQPFQMWIWKKKKGPFEGKVFEDGCEIQRVIRYRNSFLPRINGQFRPSDYGSELDFKMALHPFVYAFMTAWLGFVSMFVFGIVILLFSDRSFEFFMLIPFIMLLFGFGLLHLPFRIEAKIAKKELEKIYSDAIVKTYIRSAK